MRVALITTLAGPSPAAGGVWEVVRVQSEALAAAGADVRVYAGWIGGSPPQGSTVRHLNLRRLTPGHDLRTLVPQGLRSASNEISAWADVVHVHLCRDWVTTPTLPLLQQSRTPIIAQCHGMLGRADGLSKRLYDAVIGRRARNKVTKYLYLTDQEYLDLREMDIDADALRPVHNATTDTADRWQNPSTPVFLYASRLHARKQPQAFVSAALTLLHEGHKATFWIAGDDQGEGPAIRSMIDRSKHREHFSLLGALPHHEVMRRLLSCTAMVLPSHREPYPMIVLEAAARGTPSILTIDSGLTAPIREHDAAVLVEPTIDKLRDAMRDAIDGRTDLVKLSARFRSLYDRTWRTESLGASLLSIYAECHAHCSHAM